MISCFLSGQDIFAHNIDSWRETVEKVQDSEIAAYLKKANTFSLKEADSAMVYFGKATELARSRNSKSQLADILINKGLFYQDRYSFVEAIKNLQNASLLLDEVKDYKKLALLNILIGNYYERTYYGDKAFKSYLLALNLYKKIKDEIGIANAYSRIGNIYYQKQQYDTSIEYYNKAVELYKKNKYQIGLAYCYISVGNSLADNGKYPEGLDYYNKSNAILFALNDDNGAAMNYNNIADTYLVLKEYDKALEYFEKALSLSQKMNNKHLVALIYLNVATMKFEQNDYQAAIKYANKSQVISVAVDDVGFQADNLLTLSKAYEKLNNYQKALQYKNEYIEAKEKILLDSNNGTILLFQQLIDHEKKEATINDLKIKNENIELKLISKKRLNYFFVFIFLIFVGFITFLIIQRNAKKKAYRLIAHKSEQISAMNVEIQKQRDHLTDLNSAKDKFYKIIAHDLKNPLSSIEGLTELMIEDSAHMDDKERALFLHSINSAAHKASTILNELFIWAISKEKILKTKNIELLRLISNEIELLEIQALHKKVSIDINVDENLFVCADENMLGTVFRNLISNAIKYSYSHGLISITSSNKNGFVEVTIKDNGIGMSQSELDNLFVANFNKSKKGTANEEGTGLGLVLCKDFIEKQGGEIWVQSNVNLGSEFKFTLPLAVQVEEQLVLS